MIDNLKSINKNLRLILKINLRYFKILICRNKFYVSNFIGEKTMIHEYINLKVHYPQLNGGDDVLLYSYCPDNFDEWSMGRKRKTILILPGGGYKFISQREAEPIALQYLKEDFNVFILAYTVKQKPVLHPLNPVDEVFASILYIKRNAEKYNVDIDHISILGFSAGGHLAASAGLFYQDETYSKLLNCDIDELKFKGLLLAYPVISLTNYTHLATCNIRTNGNKELIDKFSIEKHITKKFPPTFIWSTFEDDNVSPLNSVMLIEQLIKNNVRVEFHLYPEGHHGLSLANEITCSKNNPDKYESVHTWIENSIRFIKDYL